jgi:hypothetical protein
MSKFMLIYRAPMSVLEQMASTTPEQREAAGEAWRVWATRVDYAITDLGAPLAHTSHVGSGSAGTDGVCGYSLLEAGSADEVGTLLEGHPHLATPGGSIEVLEIIPVNV